MSIRPYLDEFDGDPEIERVLRRARNDPGISPGYRQFRRQYYREANCRACQDWRAQP